MSPNRYIAIEGVIGVGKTTLARYLSQELEASLLLEVFDENPFLADFYADRQQYAFQTQVFFLLSRYRHQHREIPQALEHGDLVSDYTFAKDMIFAQVNLSGDEFATYINLHQALAESIIAPDLIVYLDADISTVLQRIAIRDRSYERSIDPAYLQTLASAYERFLAESDLCPSLIINTDDLDIVRNADDRQHVIQRVRSALGEGTHQPALPQLAPAASPSASPTAPLAPGDAPAWQRLLSGAAPTQGDPALALLRLVEQVGRLSGAVGAARWDAVASDERPRAAQLATQALGLPLLEALASLVEIAELSGIDLQPALGESLARQASHTARTGE